MPGGEGHVAAKWGSLSELIPGRGCEEEVNREMRRDGQPQELVVWLLMGDEQKYDCVKTREGWVVDAESQLAS